MCFPNINSPPQKKKKKTLEKILSRASCPGFIECHEPGWMGDRESKLSWIQDSQILLRVSKHHVNVLAGVCKQENHQQEEMRILIFKIKHLFLTTHTMNTGKWIDVDLPRPPKALWLGREILWVLLARKVYDLVCPLLQFSILVLHMFNKFLSSYQQS